MSRYFVSFITYRTYNSCEIGIPCCLLYYIIIKYCYCCNKRNYNTNNI